MNENELVYHEEKQVPDEREVTSSYEVAAGGGVVHHEFDERGNHRLRAGQGWAAEGTTGDWSAYQHTCVLRIPGTDPRFMLVGVTAYGLLDNVHEMVCRVEVLGGPAPRER